MPNLSVGELVELLLRLAFLGGIIAVAYHFAKGDLKSPPMFHLHKDDDDDGVRRHD